jgi:predicted MFS family arabinose efflux permease
VTRSHVSLAAYYTLIRGNRNFRLLWLAQIVSEIGDWFYSVAIYDLVFRLTGSAQLVGAAVLIQVLPMFFLGPTAGAVNDRLSRKKVMIAADLARAAVVLGMVLVHRRDQLWILFILLGAEVLGAAFFEPGRTAVLPNIVGGSDIMAANALSSATWSFNLAIGAGIGGIVVHFFGRTAAFVVNSLSFLGSAALLRGMDFTEPHVAEHRHLGWVEILGLAPIVEGVRYVRGDLRLASLLFLKFGLGLLGANLVILPMMGEKEFHIGGGGVLGMSTLFMFRGVGAIIGPFIGGRLAGSSQSRMRVGVLAAYLTTGFFYLLFSHAPSLAAASLCVVGAHAAGSVIWVFSTTLLQLNTEDRFRGRMFAADFGVLTLAVSISAYMAGFAIDHGVSPRTAALSLGCVMLFPAVVWALALRMWRAGPPEASGPLSLN